MSMLNTAMDSGENQSSREVVKSGDWSPANTICWPNAGLLLAQRRSRWANISPALGQRLVNELCKQWCWLSLHSAFIYHAGYNNLVKSHSKIPYFFNADIQLFLPCSASANNNQVSAGNTHYVDARVEFCLKIAGCMIGPISICCNCCNIYLTRIYD